MSDSQRRPIDSKSESATPSKEQKHAAPADAGSAPVATHPAGLFYTPSLLSLAAAAYVANYVKNHKQVQRSRLVQFLKKNDTPDDLTREILKQLEVWFAKKNFREYILQNNLHEALAILRVHQNNRQVLQDLLFERGTIENNDATQDRFGDRRQHLRILEGSAFQLMIWSHNVDDGLKMMEPFINLVDPKRSLAREQFVQQLPQFSALLAPKAMDSKLDSAIDEKMGREISIDKIYTSTPPYSVDSLTQAIAADSCVEEKGIRDKTRAELEKFAAYLHPRPPTVSSEGCYANFPLFIRAFTHLSGNWNLAQKNLLWSRVILPLIETFPAAFASRLNFTSVRVRDDDLNHVPGSFQKFQCLQVWANANALYHEKTMDLRQLIDWLQNPGKQLEARPAFLGSPKC